MRIAVRHLHMSVAAMLHMAVAMSPAAHVHAAHIVVLIALHCRTAVRVLTREGNTS